MFKHTPHYTGEGVQWGSQLVLLVVGVLGGGEGEGEMGEGWGGGVRGGLRKLEGDLHNFLKHTFGNTRSWLYIMPLDVHCVAMWINTRRFERNSEMTHW